jgi:phage antirepressor YoqD-like protein
MNELIPVEYQNQRILTTQQLAESYQATEDQIKHNFNRNDNRYIKNKHYFLLEGEELRDFKRDGTICDLAPNVNKLYLWTEKGALLHAKSLNTDIAWAVYDSLVENYFNPKHNLPSDYLSALKALVISEETKIQLLEENREQKEIIAELAPKAEFFDAVAESADAIDIGSAAKVLNMGIGRNKLFEFLRDSGVLMANNQPYQKHCDAGYFRTVESRYTKPDGSTPISIKTLVYQRGLDYIRRLYARTVAQSGNAATVHALPG